MNIINLSLSSFSILFLGLWMLNKTLQQHYKSTKEWDFFHFLPLVSFLILFVSCYHKSRNQRYKRFAKTRESKEEKAVIFSFLFRSPWIVATGATKEVRWATCVTYCKFIVNSSLAIRTKERKLNMWGWTSFHLHDLETGPLTESFLKVLKSQWRLGFRK